MSTLHIIAMSSQTFVSASPLLNDCKLNGHLCLSIRPTASEKIEIQVRVMREV